MPKKAKVNKYISKNYQWIIGSLLAIITILVAIIVVPWGVRLQTKAAQKEIENTLKTTTTYYFTPTNNVELAKVKDGANCWTFSDSSTRTDAYRCKVGDSIYDPCFYQITIGYVDCPSEPTAHNILTVSKIERNDPLKKSEVQQFPWYVTLETGQKCRFITGVTDVIADERIDYSCSEKGWWLSRPINNDGGLLNIRCFNPSLNRIEVCKLREAWY